jgi:stage V sporulation protein B
VLASAFARGGGKNLSSKVESLFRVTLLIAFPCAFGLSVFARPILRLLFRADMADSAAPYLSLLALAVVFLSLLTVSNTVLQASQNAGKATVSMLIGAAVKFASNYFLIGFPAVGSFGVPLGTLLCYLTATLSNLLFAFRRVSISLPLGRVFLRPFAASLLSVGAASGLYLLLGGDAGDRFSVVLCILLAAVVYLACVLLLGCLTEEDLSFVPGGKKIGEFLHFSPKKRHFLEKNRQTNKKM